MFEPPFCARALRTADEAILCSWVNSARKLAMVSGDSGPCLTPEILRQWVAKAEYAIVVADIASDRPLGFSTLSTIEAPALPRDCIEQCHLIVDPRQPYFTVGARLCQVARRIAGQFGYAHLCGRVSPDNPYGLALVQRQKATELPADTAWTPEGFRWFAVNVSAYRSTHWEQYRTMGMEVANVC